MYQSEKIGEKLNKKIMENISLEEKIDFIYKKLKREEKERKRKLFLKYFFRISLLLIIIYMYFFWIKQIINWVKKSFLETIDSKTTNLKENIQEKTKKFKESINNKIDNFNNNQY